MARTATTAFNRIVAEAGNRGYSRRTIVKGAAALGLAAPVAGLGLHPSGSRVMAQDAAPEGKIVIALAAEPSTMENWNAYSVDGHPVLRNIFEALLNRDPETNELIGELAERWERTDERTLRFKLREGVTYHNGDPFNAEVAAAGLNYTWSLENAFDITQFIGPEITATAVDEYTLDVATAEADPILAERLYFSPLPNMTQVEQDPDSLPSAPIGTGPYQLDEWNRGENILLSAYSDWWGAGNPEAKGAQAIDEVEFVFRGESPVRAAMVTAGEAHIGRFLAPEDCETTPVCEKTPSIETVFLRFDSMHPVLGDVRVREAVGLAMDKEQLAASVFGEADIATQMVGPSASGYNTELEAAPYDMDRAAELVEEAAADGVPIEMEITVAVRAGAYPRTEEFGEYIANQLNEIGLNARTEVIEHAAYQEQYVTPFDEIPEDRGWIGTLTHGNEMMDVGQTASGYYVCSGGVSTWCDEAFDGRVAEAAALSGDERGAAFEEITREFMSNYPVIPIVHLPLFYGLSADLVWEPRLDGFILVKEMSFA